MASTESASNFTAVALGSSAIRNATLRHCSAVASYSARRPAGYEARVCNPHWLAVEGRLGNPFPIPSLPSRQPQFNRTRIIPSLPPAGKSRSNPRLGRGRQQHQVERPDTCSQGPLATCRRLHALPADHASGSCQWPEAIARVPAATFQCTTLQCVVVPAAGPIPRHSCAQSRARASVLCNALECNTWYPHELSLRPCSQWPPSHASELQYTALLCNA